MTTSLGLNPESPTHPFPSLQSALSDTAESLSSDLLSSSPIPTLVLDHSLAIRCVSDGLLGVLGGRGREQLLGSHVDAIFDPKLPLPPLAVIREALSTAEKTKRLHKLNHVQPDGRTAWSIRCLPIFRHGTLRCIQMELYDTTEDYLKQLELEERITTNETFRILVETVRDYAIFMLDPKGNVATWNAGAEFFKGWKREEIVGRHFSNFYGKEDRDNDKPGRELRDAIRDGRCEDEGWRYRKDGSRFWANVVITPVYRGDTLIGFSKVTRDLTERRRAEEKLVSAFEEASKLKSEFLANMSHEIRTPMHGMLSALTLLLDTQLNPEQLDLAKVIQESGEVLLQVINDILDYSKLASGSFSVSSDIISVTDIIQSVFRSYEKCHTPDIVLESNLDPRLPKAAEGDSLRYRQIVQNLMSNATKFTEDGYVQVNAHLQEEDDDSYLILTEVIDTGIGIPPAASSSLFTPFTQFDNSATKRYKGTGLGLSICKSLAELLGGHIGFRPNPGGRGSIFWFTARLKKIKQLKHLETSQDQSRALAVSTPATPIEDIKLAAVNRSVLLAEDNQINQKVMIKMLSGLGFDDIDLANDGREAVNMAVEHSPPYDIILMDINMPLLDGVTAAKEIRFASIHSPVIAMTANALKGHAESYIAKGMTDYISKPVDRKHLVKILLNCLNQGGLQSSHEPR
ncbi:hypothetical protein CC78DRAFT_622345 [Lojkania enalia]|uniref:Two-component system protein A n=1 Tax=Lojkania enalia TaxID=147567 RepID=A0A9P4JV95_9PLEO|nr:hypothetical protein CC78DRAFT_622345 [Didymosphaeria enalia]